MKHIESHFKFTNQQRNGIFLLMLVIFGLQVVYFFSKSNNNVTQEEDAVTKAYRAELDSLKLVKSNDNSKSIFPFNPNYITDYKGYTLGMSNEEIDRLHQFRSGNKWVNSAKEFQDVTQISDSLLNRISPYFKFPEWVNKPTKKFSNSKFISKNKTYSQKGDLNKATQQQLQKVYGIGEKLSERIIIYRNKLKGGFHSEIELTEIYGLTDEVIDNLKNHFVVKTPRPIKTYNLNTATRDELVLIKYIDYEVANNIIEERTLRDGFKSLEELTKVEDFPLNKYEIIKLYLHL